MKIFITVIVLTAAGVVFLIWSMALFLLSFTGGWRRLARTFSTDKSPEGDSFGAASGRMRIVNYSFILNVTVSREGIFMSVMKLFRPFHSPLFIPWDSIISTENKSLLLNRHIEIGIKDRKGHIFFTLSDKVLSSQFWRLKPHRN